MNHTLAQNAGADARPARQPAPTTESVTTPAVLVIEDDQDVHDGWVLYLRHHGYDVSSATDGVAGLRAIVHVGPDLVLLDLGLPELHGLDLIRHVREAGLTVPIVVVTASSSLQVETEARALGADAVFSKPIDSHLLLPVFDELLERSART